MTPARTAETKDQFMHRMREENPALIEEFAKAGRIDTVYKTNARIELEIASMQRWRIAELLEQVVAQLERITATLDRDHGTDDT